MLLQQPVTAASVLTETDHNFRLNNKVKMAVESGYQAITHMHAK